jgi:polyisoprenyl-teichoic acid--peptidoglycan teichoic acid transferase
MKLKRVILTLLTLVILSAAGVVGYYAYAWYSFTNKIQQPGAATSLPEWVGNERVNVLLLGVDKRDGEKSARSDSILLASLDPVTKKAQLFSILRDSWVSIPGYRNNRINTAYELGGPELIAQTVEDLTGLPINYYVVTDFRGFEKVVDAVGGVDMYVEKNMDYTLYDNGGYYDIHLKQGYQHLDGHKALQYVRFRHDAMGDFTRTQRQRNFLKALGTKLKSGTGIWKLPDVLDAMSPYIKTNMSSSDMLRLAALGYSVDMSTVKSEQIPPQSILREKLVGGAQVIDPRPEKTRKYIQDLLNANP